MAGEGLKGAYKHLMTGVSYMLPFVVAGGLLIAIGFAARGIYAYDPAMALDGTKMEPTAWTTFWANVFTIGAKGGFGLMVAVLSGYIAYSIADRPGLTPGMIGGVLAGITGSGFLGGIISGFLAGYFTKWLNGAIKLPRNLAGLKPVLILPLISTLVVGLIMFYVVGVPVSGLLKAMTAWLTSMQTSSALVLGLILGAMMAFDMGGPVNKAAYTFAVGLLASQVYAPMAAVMAAGMTPPLGVALASYLFKNRFSEEERKAGCAAAVLGIAFVTEGAIPFAARDPIRVIPALMTGSAVAGALSMVFGAQLHVPHGGVFVLPIPNAVDNLLPYIAAIAIGTVVTAAMLFVLKKPIPQEAA